MSTPAKSRIVVSSALLVGLLLLVMSQANAPSAPLAPPLRLSAVAKPIAAATAKASAQPDCEAVLRHGLFNTTFIHSSGSSQELFDQFIYDMNFETHDQAINAGISVGVPVYGVPLQIGGTFSKQQKDIWYEQHINSSHHLSTSTETYRLLQKRVAPEILRAWTECVITTITPTPLAAQFKAISEDTATLVVKWNPIEGDTGGKPTVKYSEIAGGFRNIDGTAKVFDLDTILTTGDNPVIIKRTPSKLLTVVIRTTRGGVTASLSPIVKAPTINSFDASKPAIARGEKVTLSWKSSGGQEARIDGVGLVPLEGSVQVQPAQNKNYALTVSNDGGEVSKKLTVLVHEPPPVVTAISITFHTTNDDKNDDSPLFVQLRTSDMQRLMADYNLPRGRFPDWSTRTESLRIYGQIQVAELSGAFLEVRFEPPNNDTWRFWVEINASRSDGLAYHYTSPILELRESPPNRRKWDVHLPAPLLRQ